MTKARTMTILHHWIYVANCTHDETTRIIKAFKWIIAFNIKSHQIPISTHPWNLLPLLPNTLVYICKFKNIKTINLKILIRNLNHRLILQPCVDFKYANNMPYANNLRNQHNGTTIFGKNRSINTWTWEINTTCLHISLHSK